MEIFIKRRMEAVDVRILREEDIPDEAPPELLALARALAPSIYLDVGNVCNQACVYCSVCRDQAYRAEPEDLLAVAAAAAGRGFSRGTFIGGEPTLWPPLRRWMGAARRLGFDEYVLTTNGLALTYEKLVDLLLENGLAVVGLSLDDPRADVHNRLAGRPDAAPLAMRALENILKKPTIHTYVHAVLTGINREAPVLLAEELARRTEDREGPLPVLLLTPLKPVGGALQRWDDLGLTLTETADAIGRGLERADELGIPAGFRDLPFCLAPAGPERSMDQYHGHLSMELSTGRLTPWERPRAPACEGCPARVCPVPGRDYLDRYGEDELSPLGTVSPLGTEDGE